MTTIAFGELPPEVQVAWDRDMCHEPWVSEQAQFWEFLESDPPRYVAWSPSYHHPGARFAAYVVEDKRWYRFKSATETERNPFDEPWRNNVITDP